MYDCLKKCFLDLHVLCNHRKLLICIVHAGRADFFLNMGQEDFFKGKGEAKIFIKKTDFLDIA